ncbi:hypothetical protein Celaphus_00013946 [Cervus elaphus hippelaphus]|uniref:SRCR domain-containing protein n=1 Tax=Cervus elaphus hippelaphus TaxID=46360 RepID=A0A212CDK6_CEREH|nr:hypothetical protein Celaphus_00013946 [Cervus elaphus hippelaphus]
MLHVLQRRKPILCVKGSRGTICDYRWDLNDARVVCRQLRCEEALDATVSSSFGAGSGPIWLDSVRCTGKECHVWNCPFQGWGKHYCDHNKDAGVICSDMVSSLPTSWENGKFQESWCLIRGTILAHEKCILAMTVKFSLLIPSYSTAGKKSFPTIACEVLFPIVKPGFVRLAGGDGPCSGRVEVHSGEVWTPVSDGNSTLSTAQVICAELGCGKPVSVLGHVLFRESDGRVWAEEFRCEGEEPKLRVCPRVPCPGGRCHHSGAAQVVCSDSRQLRLVDGGGPCAGRVEILDQGSWGTICDDNWDLDDARVVCKQLSCGEALDATISSYFGAGSGPIWLDEVNCRGEESQVWSCPSWGWRQHNCDHQEDAGVICSGMVSSLSTG